MVSMSVKEDERVCGVSHLHRVLRLAAREQGPAELALSLPPPRYERKMWRTIVA